MTTYRVGRHQPQNVYRDDQYIGVMFTTEDAQLAVEALNVHADPGRCPAIHETSGMRCNKRVHVGLHVAAEGVMGARWMP